MIELQMHCALSTFKKITSGAVVAVFALLATACATPRVWSSPEIRARVVDENGKPIQGAVVVMVWMAKMPTGHPALGGSIAVEEALTNENGDFVIPAWGPRTAASVQIDPAAYMRASVPETFIFHPNYVPVTEYNIDHSVPNYSLGFARGEIKFHKNGKAFEMEKFVGTATEHVQKLSYLGSSIKWIALSGTSCPHQKIPRMVASLHKMRIQLEQATDEVSSLPSLNMFVQPAIENRCGSTREFFKEYLK